jgi:hypothetical protein
MSYSTGSSVYAEEGTSKRARTSMARQRILDIGDGSIINNILIIAKGIGIDVCTTEELLIYLNRPMRMKIGKLRGQSGNA